MFRTLKAGHKPDAIGAKWASVTSVDPGGNGQVAEGATKYMFGHGMEPEGAWLTAMIAWMSGMLWPDSSCMAARAMLQFRNAREGKFALSAATAGTALQTAQQILSNR